MEICSPKSNSNQFQKTIASRPTFQQFRNKINESLIREIITWQGGIIFQKTSVRYGCFMYVVVNLISAPCTKLHGCPDFKVYYFTIWVLIVSTQAVGGKRQINKRCQRGTRYIQNRSSIPLLGENLLLFARQPFVNPYTVSTL